MLKNDPILHPLRMHGHMVPGIWQYLLPKEIFSWRLPEERQATCMSCPRIVTDGYRKDYRCCTYHPSVPNYALGLALQSPTGAEPVRALIKAGAVLPEGSLHTPQEWYNYLTVTSGEHFGNNSSVLCKLLDPKTGFCNIYAFRNSVCSTFFCLHDHGKKGFKFWDRMQEMVGQIESMLLQWALHQVGFDLEHYYAALNELADDMDQLTQPEGGWTEPARQQVYGAWFGREEELMIACAKVVSANRDRLWEIANEWQMLEAETFEKKQLAGVPAELQDEVDDSDWEEGEAMRPKELWMRLKKSYQRLWTTSDHKLVLSARVEISPNALDDAESKHFAEQPYELCFLTKKDPDTYDWRMFISEEERNLLKRFKRPCRVTKSVLKALTTDKITDPEGRIAEWVSRKVIVPAK